jgi:hypothetical protein
MWKIALLAVVAITVTVGPSRAEVEGPWCSHESVGGGVIAQRCHFTSEAQCRQMSPGGSVFCTQNPRYTGPTQSSRREKKPK